MHQYWVALAVSFAAALLVVPSGVKALRAAGLVRQNYRKRKVAFPMGGAAGDLVAGGPGAAGTTR